MTNTAKAAFYAGRLRGNSQNYHEGRITYERFTSANESIWRRVESEGLVALVSAHLRFPMLAEVQS